MIISNEKWDAIVAEVKAKIERWQAQADKHAIKETFRARIVPLKSGECVVLVTEHCDASGDLHNAHAVVREATGQMRPARVHTRNDRLVYVSKKSSYPKAWRSLVDKPAADIVRKIGLLDFLLVHNVTAVAVTSGEVSAGGKP
jgi:hypothetical protein